MAGNDLVTKEKLKEYQIFEFVNDDGDEIKKKKLN